MMKGKKGGIQDAPCVSRLRITAAHPAPLASHAPGSE